MIDAHSIIDGAETSGPLTIAVTDPAQYDTVVGRTSDADADTVDEAVRAAAAAQASWSSTALDDRIAALLRAAEAIETARDDLAPLLSREAGTPIAQAEGEVAAAALAFRSAAGFAAEVLTERTVHASVRRRQRPAGVVAAIVPWNAPLALAAQKLAPALVAGNTVVLKPSPLAPLAVTALVRELLTAIGRPVVSVVQGAGVAGAALVAHPGLARISFTGGGATARMIMAAAAANLTPVHFELGGNDPALLLDDADVDLAAERIAQFAFRRSGQVCYAIKRVYLPRALREEFVGRLIAAVDAHVVGRGLDRAVTMGPVIDQARVETVGRLAEDSRTRGRTVHELGRAAHPEDWHGGHFVHPTLVVDAGQDDPLVREEQFAPILPLVIYDQLEEAIDWANGTEYGLASSVWSRDLDRAEEVARRIEAGVTFINDHALSAQTAPHIPFGGVKQSGIGWENSPVGLAEYTDHHSIAIGT